MKDPSSTSKDAGRENVISLPWQSGALTRGSEGDEMFTKVSGIAVNVPGRLARG